MKIDQIVMTSAAVDRLDSIALLMGLDGYILDANPAALDCYGRSRAEIVGLSIHDLRAPGIQDDIDKQMRRAIDHGVVYETVHHHGDGSLFPVEVRSTPVFIDGEPALLSLVRDLTERKHAEQELEESESRYRALAESSPLAVFVSRNEQDDDQVVLANPACVKLFGASSPEELFGTSAMELFEPDSRALVRERIDKVGEAVVLVEARIVRLDGTPLDVEVTASPLLDQGVAAIQIVLYDITERKLDEKELRQSQEKFATAFNASPDLIAITRLSDGELLEVNEGFLTLLGYARAESLGKTTVELSIWTDPAARAEFIRLLAETGGVKDYEATFRRKDGTLVPTLMSARVIEIDGQECILSVIHDITERKRAEDVIRKNATDLREAQRIGQFGSFDWDATTDNMVWSDEYYRICGFDPRQGPLGYEERLKTYSPESAARLDAAVMKSMQMGEPYVLDLEQVSPDGTRKWITARGEATRDADGKIMGLRGTAQDITERRATEEHIRRLNRVYAVLSAINQAIVHMRQPQELFDEACRVIVEEGGLRAAWVGLVDTDGKRVRPVAQAGAIDGYLETVDVILGDEQRGQGPTGISISERRHATSPDIEHDPGMAPWREDALRRGYRSSAAFPLIVGDEAVGVVAMYADDPDFFAEDQLGLLDELAADISFAMEFAEGEKRRRQGEAELERRGVRLAELLEEREHNLAQLARSLSSIIDVVSQVVEIRDPYTAGHQRRVSELAVRISEEMGMSAEQIDEIRVAALIHDVGKMSVPAEILSKPGALLPEEFAIIKRHAEAGYRIIASANMEGPTAEIVYQHHERCDGSGYPRGLSAEQLLPSAKVLMVADVVEAMTSHRPYRPALGPDMALAEIERGAGSLYDAEVCQACTTVFRVRGFTFSET